MLGFLSGSREVLVVPFRQKGTTYSKEVLSKSGVVVPFRQKGTTYSKEVL